MIFQLCRSEVQEYPGARLGPDGLCVHILHHTSSCFFFFICMRRDAGLIQSGSCPDSLSSHIKYSFMSSKRLHRHEWLQYTPRGNRGGHSEVPRSLLCANACLGEGRGSGLTPDAGGASGLAGTLGRTCHWQALANQESPHYPHSTADKAASAARGSRHWWETYAGVTDNILRLLTPH